MVPLSGPGPPRTDLGRERLAVMLEQLPDQVPGVVIYVSAAAVVALVSLALLLIRRHTKQ